MCVIWSFKTLIEDSRNWCIESRQLIYFFILWQHQHILYVRTETWSFDYITFAYSLILAIVNIFHQYLIFTKLLVVLFRAMSMSSRVPSRSNYSERWVCRVEFHPAATIPSDEYVESSSIPQQLFRAMSMSSRVPSRSNYSERWVCRAQFHPAATILSDEYVESSSIP